MGRILYIVYLWLFFVPVFLVLTILTAVTVIIGCLLGGEKIFAYYPGMIWSRLTCYLALCPVTPSFASEISTHVLDLARGVGGAGIPATLERKDEDGTWRRIATAQTDNAAKIDAMFAGRLNMMRITVVGRSLR